jgi:hypothetical protein
MEPRIHVLGARLALGLVLLGTVGQEVRANVADVYDLNAANVGFGGGEPYASVAISSPGAGQVQFVVTALTSPADTIGEFGFNTDLERTFRTSRANFSTQPVAAIEISVPICASEREKPVCHKFFEGNRFRQMCGTGVGGHHGREFYDAAK